MSLFSLGRFRQYGLWERYADLYPDKDLVYTVGVDDYRKDWFFAQVTRYVLAFETATILLCNNSIILIL